MIYLTAQEIVTFQHIYLCAYVTLSKKKMGKKTYLASRSREWKTNG